MPNIIPCRIWNYQFSPDAARRARQYPESDGRHPKHDAPVPYPEPGDVDPARELIWAGTGRGWVPLDDPLAPPARRTWQAAVQPPEVAVYAEAYVEAYVEAERLRVLAVFAADASTDLATIPGDGKPARVRQFPEPHRWTPLSLLDQ